MKDLLNEIKGIYRKAKDTAFDLALSALTGISKVSTAAKKLKVSVRINNAVKAGDTNRKVALLAQKTWTDLLSEKATCKLDGAINTTDLVITIQVVDKKLCISAESEYLKKSDPTGEVSIAFKEFIDSANEVVDEITGRDRSLNLDESLGTYNNTKQVNTLTSFFNNKIDKIFFAVKVKKFVAEVGK